MGKAIIKSNPSKAKSAAKKPVKHVSSGGNHGSAGGTLKPAEDRILQAMGKLYHAKMPNPERDLIQKFSGNAKTLEGFKKNMGKLKKSGYVEYPDGKTAALTDQGISYVGYVDPSSVTNEAIHVTLKELVGPGKPSEIFDALVDGKVHLKSDLAKQLGYDLNKLSGYEKTLSKMSKLDVIEKTKTTIQLNAAKCFPFGR